MSVLHPQFRSYFTTTLLTLLITFYIFNERNKLLFSKDALNYPKDIYDVAKDFMSSVLLNFIFIKKNPETTVKNNDFKL